MRATVAFIIPASRDGLERRGRALRSLLAQSDPDWIAVAIGEGHVPSLPLESRYFAVKGPEHGKTGGINAALDHLHLANSVGDLRTEWVMVLDEHDTVSEHTVARVKDVSDYGTDVIAFRTQCPRGVVLPNRRYPALVPGEVGSGLMFRREFMEGRRVKFSTSIDPMADVLAEANEHGARVLLHPSISYFEKNERPGA